MDDRFLNPRNQTLEFAKRSRKNLEFIETAYAEGSDVHPVTQLTLSMLGLVVFPWGERKQIEAIAKKKTLQDLESEGWPTWNILQDDYKDNPTNNLYTLTRRLRNAVAHGQVKFTSDSGKIEDVKILVEDKRSSKGSKTKKRDFWVAEIEATKLRAFCFKFFDFIDDYIG